MLKDISYRKLTIEDLDLLLKMKLDFRTEFIKKEQAKLFLANPMNWLIACLKKNQIIGFAYAYELHRLDDKGNMLYIHEIGILENYQRMGLGKGILASIKKRAQAKGLYKIFLITGKSNIPACSALYKSMNAAEANPDSVVFVFT